MGGAKHIGWLGLKFSILSAEDGRPSISRAAQNIVKQKIPSENIDIALVDKFVHGNYYYYYQYYYLFFN